MDYMDWPAMAPYAWLGPDQESIFLKKALVFIFNALMVLSYGFPGIVPGRKLLKPMVANSMEELIMMELEQLAANINEKEFPFEEKRSSARCCKTITCKAGPGHMPHIPHNCQPQAYALRLAYTIRLCLTGGIPFRKLDKRISSIPGVPKGVLHAGNVTFENVLTGAIAKLREDETPCAQELCQLGQLQARAALVCPMSMVSASLLQEALQSFDAALKENSLDENTRACLAFIHLRLGHYDQALKVAEGSWWCLHPDEDCWPPHLHALISTLRSSRQGGYHIKPRLSLHSQQKIMQWAAAEIAQGGPLIWQCHSLLVALPWLLDQGHDQRSEAAPVGEEADLIMKNIARLACSLPAEWSPSPTARLKAASMKLPTSPPAHHMAPCGPPQVPRGTNHPSMSNEPTSPAADVNLSPGSAAASSSDRTAQPGAETGVSIISHPTVHPMVEDADKAPASLELMNSPKAANCTDASWTPTANTDVKNCLALKFGQLLGWKQACEAFKAVQRIPDLSPAQQPSIENLAILQDQAGRRRQGLVLEDTILALSPAMHMQGTSPDEYRSPVQHGTELSATVKGETSETSLDSTVPAKPSSQLTAGSTAESGSSGSSGSPDTRATRTTALDDLARQDHERRMLRNRMLISGTVNRHAGGEVLRDMSETPSAARQISRGHAAGRRQHVGYQREAMRWPGTGGDHAARLVGDVPEPAKGTKRPRPAARARRPAVCRPIKAQACSMSQHPRVLEW